MNHFFSEIEHSLLEVGLVVGLILLFAVFVAPIIQKRFKTTPTDRLPGDW